MVSIGAPGGSESCASQAPFGKLGAYSPALDGYHVLFDRAAASIAVSNKIVHILVLKASGWSLSVGVAS